MVVEETKLDGVRLIKPEYFEDHRGRYVESYSAKDYKKLGIDVDFVQDDFSFSKKDVLRGIHGDEKTWKLVSCIRGEFFLAVVNCDPNSKLFGEHETFNLSEDNLWQVLIPPKYGNGHLALTDRIVFHYKQSTYYEPGTQFTYAWDDPRFNIVWPIDRPILSSRDKLDK